MSVNRTIRQIVVGAALLAGVAGAAQAQSVWKAVAQAIAPKTEQGAQAQPVKPVDQKTLATNAALSVKQAYQQIQPTTEMAAAQVRSAMTTIGNKLPAFGAKPELGFETDETTSSLAVNLFHDPEIRKLLGDSPRFIYNPEGKTDPMLVPWVRRAAIFRELCGKADAQLAAGQVDQAVATYKKILDMHDQRFVMVVQQKLAEIGKQQQVEAANAAKTQAQQLVAEQVELPQWIQENTTGVLFEKNKVAKGGLCLVGEYMLHVGEALPNYPEITVAAIGEKSVTYRFRNHEFNVELNKQ